jgi:LCP family protein required for cell wall assembly
MMKSRKRKVLLIILISFVSFLLIILATIFFVLHGYINKLNLVEKAKGTGTENTSLELQNEEPNRDLASHKQLADRVSAVEEPSEEPSEKSSEKSSEEKENLTIEYEEEANAPDSPKEEIHVIEERIRKNMEENSTPIVYDKKVLNILLIGSDSRNEEEDGRSDAMILLSINKKTKTITATSFLRDIYLKIPGRSNNRINTAYANGGADLLLETIRQNFKIEINRYVSVHFNSFIDAVDAVGGVTLEITEKEIPVINQYVRELNLINGDPEESDLLTESGTYLLNGIQTLGYTRNRYVGYYDFDRTARQREVLELIFHKIKNLSLKKLNNLLNILLPQITTNLTEGELFTLILSLPSYKGYSLEQWSIPVEDSYSFLTIRGMSVIGIDFEENINRLQEQIYGEDR